MSREYRKRKRAESEAQTAQRITEATMRLHETVGPAATTVSAIADRAGVQRATVYRHFPDEGALFAACSAHWIGLNPSPAIDAWAAIDDPGDRLRLALGEMYAWYDRTEPMVERLLADRASVPVLDQLLSARDAQLEAATEVLVKGWGQRGRARRRVRAAIAHALEFETWRSLVRRQGLDPRAAVDLVSSMVAAA